VNENRMGARGGSIYTCLVTQTCRGKGYKSLRSINFIWKIKRVNDICDIKIFGLAFLYLLVVTLANYIKAREIHVTIIISVVCTVTHVKQQQHFIDRGRAYTCMHTTTHITTFFLLEMPGYWHEIYIECSPWRMALSFANANWPSRFTKSMMLFDNWMILDEKFSKKTPIGQESCLCSKIILYLGVRDINFSSTSQEIMWSNWSCAGSLP